MMSTPFGGQLQFTPSPTDPTTDVEMIATLGSAPKRTSHLPKQILNALKHSKRKNKQKQDEEGEDDDAEEHVFSKKVVLGAQGIRKPQTILTREMLEANNHNLALTNKEDGDNGLFEQKVTEECGRQKRCPVEEVDWQSEKRAMSVVVSEPDEDQLTLPSLFTTRSSHPTSHPSSLSLPPSSALLSQIHLDPTDATPPSLIDTTRRDTDNQPIDTRTHNSWVATIDQVSSVELVEVHLINSFAPFVLISQLEALMAQDQSTDHFVVNVSAMEGKFHRTFKSFNHPHTNMAKASLNMLTRTSASDLARRRIFMNAVDTGWITDEKPLHAAVRAEEGGFSPPLDEVDAMARILDPIFVGVNTGVLHFGKFFKDYFVSEW
ncbi:putative L-fuco-beta-pyranose dehydrogenase [Blattamonas nauphoetae]|uniref:L-fuco-beta-pyranose dehydrogenase n=1 Tax=Blattamonas nauphoetae TaxID=2049346 RepID=A0ABQ9XJJ8_9EUKA|nr:putative L-fuco-beta-pyranose dehydrogenase [Blattamonas nauphoetae]